HTISKRDWSSHVCSSDLEERLERSLATIDESADRLSTLISDLLDVSRIRTGQLPLRLRLVDLNTTLRQVSDRYRDHLDERHQLRSEEHTSELQSRFDLVC